MTGAWPESRPGTAAMQRDGWTLTRVVIVDCPRTVDPGQWLWTRVEVETDDWTIDTGIDLGVDIHRRFVAGRYDDRLPTNRRRKRQRAKAKRRDRAHRFMFESRLASVHHVATGPCVIGDGRVAVSGEGTEISVGYTADLLPYQREFIEAKPTVTLARARRLRGHSDYAVLDDALGWLL